MEPIPSTVTKTYPPRGPLQQYRFAEGTAFRCFRCGDTKKSKLITIYSGDWSRKLCNGFTVGFSRFMRSRQEPQRRTNGPNNSQSCCFHSPVSTNGMRQSASSRRPTIERACYALRPFASSQRPSMSLHSWNPVLSLSGRLLSLVSARPSRRRS